MRLSARALLLLAASAAATPALAQESGLVRIDPCTGQPYAPGTAPAEGRPSISGPPGGAPSAPGQPTGGSSTSGQPVPGQPAGQPSANGSSTPQAGTPAPVAPSAEPLPGSGTPTSATTPYTVVPPVAGGGTSGTAMPEGRFMCSSITTGDPARAARNREQLRLGRGAVRGQVRLGPAASVSVPTAFGVDAGELFLGAAYQGRTRYTQEDDAAAVAGIGIGTRRVVALEVALTTYSTLRGVPLETGGLSFKLHRALPRNTSVAVGWENAVLWGGSDDDGSLYAVATHTMALRENPADRFSLGVLTVGIGNGRFRFESDDAAGRETVNVFGAVGLRISDPVSVMADWTGQDLNLAASVTPIRRVPFVVTAGVADLTGNAGDGARFILSLGYGLSIRQPFTGR